MMKNKFHKLRKAYFKYTPDNLIFVDTETKEKIISKTEKNLEFYMGWFIHWNREDNSKKEVYFQDKHIFWDYIESLDLNNVYVFAHNTEFDFKVLDGYNILLREKGYSIKNIYMEGKVFILVVEKDDKLIYIYDTFNYCPVSLESMGISIGLHKGQVDFRIATDEQLKEYCLNDTRITQLFIENFIKFLEDNNLGGLRGTISSCAFNSFRQRFYNVKEKPIYIHNHNLAIKLERESYKGGICDCMKIGIHNEKLWKLDFNSMYPAIMRETDSPTKLLFYSRDNNKFDLGLRLNKELKEDKNLIIGRVNIYLPYNKAHLLTRFKLDKEKKNGFLWGTYDTVLTTPELLYVKKYGKINHVYELSIYEKANINAEYVDFFYNKRLESITKGDYAGNLMCKLFLNSYYGRWGMKGSTYNLLDEDNKDFDFNRLHLLKDGESSVLLQFGHRVYHIKPSLDNAYDSFVAIASFITAYARMKLIKVMNHARQENVFYMDTDCLIVNEKGFNRLKSYIDFSDDKILGKLEIEGVCDHAEFYKPKYYIFDDDLKCKGVRKKHRLIEENKEFIRIEQEQFQKYKMAFKTGSYNTQKVILIEKKMSKIYNKGKIIDGSVFPFHVDDVQIDKFNILDLK